MRALKTLLMGIGILAVTPGCLEEESKVKSGDDGYTYIADCDRHLKRAEEKSGRQYWSLSNIGCMLYKGGGVDKPASLPTVRQQFLYFTKGDTKSPKKCDLEEKSKKLYAKCDGISEKFFLGNVKNSGTVAINTFYAFNIVTWDNDHFRRWSHKTDGIDSLAKKTEIGFTQQRSPAE
jgi:hypothetical protein